MGVRVRWKEDEADVLLCSRLVLGPESAHQSCALHMSAATCDLCSLSSGVHREMRSKVSEEVLLCRSRFFREDHVHHAASSALTSILTAATVGATAAAAASPSFASVPLKA